MTKVTVVTKFCSQRLHKQGRMQAIASDCCLFATLRISVFIVKLLFTLTFCYLHFCTNFLNLVCHSILTLLLQSWSLQKKMRLLRCKLELCRPRLIWERHSWSKRPKTRRWMWIQKLSPPNTQKKYQGPKVAQEPGSTIINRGAAQEGFHQEQQCSQG